MIEGVSDAVQLLALAACFALALARALRGRSTTWVTMTCFYACMLLGNAYWLGYLLVFGETPHYSHIADLGWAAGYVFLLMLVAESDKRRGVSAPIPAAWAPVAACVACCAYYIATSGDPLLNLVDNGLLAAVGFFAVRGICARDGASPGEDPGRADLSRNRAFHWAALAFVAVEQALWLSSSLLVPGPIGEANPYIVANFALTLSYAVILACAWKSEGA